MLFAKYKNKDFSLRMGNGGHYRSHRADGNDWQQRKSEHVYVNGRQSCDALADQWTIVHAVKRDGRADEPFRYQLSSQFMNRYFKGEICEVLAYDRVLRGSEREHLEAHLSEKWNISLVHDHPGMGGGGTMVSRGDEKMVQRTVSREVTRHLVRLTNSNQPDRSGGWGLFEIERHER